MSDILSDLRAVLKLRGDTYSSAEALGMVGRAADEIERLRGLLADKNYIRTLADYNKGHLSHAGWLKAREAATLANSESSKP